MSVRRIPGGLAVAALVLTGLTGPCVVRGADLMELYRRAEEVDPSLERAQKEKVIAGYQEDQAQAGLMPRLTGQASRSWTKQKQEALFGPTPETRTETYEQDRYSLTLQQPLFLGGRTWISLDIADVSRERADATVSAARQDLMIQVAEAYFSVLDAKEELDLAKREVRRVREHLERAQAQFDVGTGDIVGVREAEARRDQAQTRLVRARNAVRTARQRLRRLIRRKPPSLNRVTEVDLAPPQPGAPEAWVERAFAEHPQLVQLRKDLTIARKNAELSSRERWPEVTAQAQYSKVEGGSFFIEDEQKSASIQLNWPLYQGGAVSADTSIQQERAAQTRLQLDDRQEEVRIQTVQSFYDWDSAMQEVRSLRAQVRSTKTQLEAVETGFEVGRRTSIDVLDAQQEYFDALRSLATARHQYLLARLRLKAASGQLTMADLEKVNRQLD